MLLALGVGNVVVSWILKVFSTMRSFRTVLKRRLRTSDVFLSKSKSGLAKIHARIIFSQSSMKYSISGTEAGSWTDSSTSEPPVETLDFHAVGRIILFGSTDMGILAGRR